MVDFNLGAIVQHNLKVWRHYSTVKQQQLEYFWIIATATKVSFSAQDHARIRKANEDKTLQGGNDKSEPPLPAPECPPGSDESGNEDVDQPETEKDKIEPSSSDISKQKHCYKLVLRDSCRKFHIKTYGSESLALFACEEFRKIARNMLQEFDIYKKKPKERKDFLERAGCDEKFLLPKTSIQSQHDAVVRRLCNGLVSHVEKSVMDKLMVKLGGDMDMTRMSIKPTEKGFSATYTGTQTTLQQSFPSLQKGFAWLKELLVADKVRVVFQILITVLYCTIW